MISQVTQVLNGLRQEFGNPEDFENILIQIYYWSAKRKIILTEAILRERIGSFIYAKKYFSTKETLAELRKKSKRET